MSGNQDQFYGNENTRRDGSFPDQNYDELTAAAPASNVRVVHGANDQPFPNLEGKTVGWIKKNLRDAFNIPSDAESLVGGEQVGDEFVVSGGQTVEFVKEAGVKG